MNKIAREAGYYINIFEDRPSKCVYIEVGPSLSDSQRKAKYVMSIDNGLIKLELLDNEDNKHNVVSIRDISRAVKSEDDQDDEEWDLLVKIYKDTIEQLKDSFNILNDDIINYYEIEGEDYDE